MASVRRVMRAFSRETPSASGFSLVELIVVSMVMSLVLAVLFRFYGHFRSIIAPKVIDRLFLQMQARKAADLMIHHIHEGSDIVQPNLGETAPFLLLKDIVNRISFYYLEFDEKNSKLHKRKLYQLVKYVSDYSGVYRKGNEVILFNSIRRLTFTPITPDSVQINVIIANEKNDFQFVSTVGILNLGNFDD